MLACATDMPSACRRSNSSSTLLACFQHPAARLDRQGGLPLLASLRLSGRWQGACKPEVFCKILQDFFETRSHLAVLIVDAVRRVVDASWQLLTWPLDLISKCVGAPLARHLADEVICCLHTPCITSTVLIQVFVWASRCKHLLDCLSRQYRRAHLLRAGQLLGCQLPQAAVAWASQVRLVPPAVMLLVLS